MHKKNIEDEDAKLQSYFDLCLSISYSNETLYIVTQIKELISISEEQLT